MDLALGPLRALQAVARHGSFSRAAAELRLTQPAVSMQIRQLEDRVGLPLLERVGKRATPTEAGELLLAHAARAFLELEAGVERVRRLRGVVAGRVRLGTSASISIYLLPPLLRRFRTRYPETELVIVTGNASEIAAAVAANELDLGVVSLPSGAASSRSRCSIATSWSPSRPRDRNGGGAGPSVPPISQPSRSSSSSAARRSGASSTAGSSAAARSPRG